MRVEFLTLSGVRRAGSLGSRTQQVRVGYTTWVCELLNAAASPTARQIMIY